jgi:K+/H+ antiporter YhaU regulatory subunit KhtT
MDYNKIFQIITVDLTTDILKSEQDLEVTINSVMDTDKKVAKIKKILGKITKLENSLEKFNELLTNNNNNNNNDN